MSKGFETNTKAEGNGILRPDIHSQIDELLSNPTFKVNTSVLYNNMYPPAYHSVDARIESHQLPVHQINDHQARQRIPVKHTKNLQSALPNSNRNNKQVSSIACQTDCSVKINYVAPSMAETHTLSIYYMSERERMEQLRRMLRDDYNQDDLEVFQKRDDGSIQVDSFSRNPSKTREPESLVENYRNKAALLNYKSKSTQTDWPLSLDNINITPAPKPPVQIPKKEKEVTKPPEVQPRRIFLDFVILEDHNQRKIVNKYPARPVMHIPRRNKRSNRLTKATIEVTSVLNNQTYVTGKSANKSKERFSFQINCDPLQTNQGRSSRASNKSSEHSYKILNSKQNSRNNLNESDVFDDYSHHDEQLPQNEYYEQDNNLDDSLIDNIEIVQNRMIQKSTPSTPTSRYSNDQLIYLRSNETPIVYHNTNMSISIKDPQHELQQQEQLRSLSLSRLSQQRNENQSNRSSRSSLHKSEPDQTTTSNMKNAYSRSISMDHHLYDKLNGLDYHTNHRSIPALNEFKYVPQIKPRKSLQSNLIVTTTTTSSNTNEQKWWPRQNNHFGSFSGVSINEISPILSLLSSLEASSKIMRGNSNNNNNTNRKSSSNKNINSENEPTSSEELDCDLDLINNLRMKFLSFNSNHSEENGDANNHTISPVESGYLTVDSSSMNETKSKQSHNKLRRCASEASVCNEQTLTDRSSIANKSCASEVSLKSLYGNSSCKCESGKESSKHKSLYNLSRSPSVQSEFVHDNSNELKFELLNYFSAKQQNVFKPNISKLNELTNEIIEVNASQPITVGVVGMDRHQIPLVRPRRELTNVSVQNRNRILNDNDEGNQSHVSGIYSLAGETGGSNPPRIPTYASGQNSSQSSYRRTPQYDRNNNAYVGANQSNNNTFNSNRTGSVSSNNANASRQPPSENSYRSDTNVSEREKVLEIGYIDEDDLDNLQLGNFDSYQDPRTDETILVDLNSDERWVILPKGWQQAAEQKYILEERLANEFVFKEKTSSRKYILDPKTNKKKFIVELQKKYKKKDNNLMQIIADSDGVIRQQVEEENELRQEKVVDYVDDFELNGIDINDAVIYKDDETNEIFMTNKYNPNIIWVVLPKEWEISSQSPYLSEENISYLNFEVYIDPTTKRKYVIDENTGQRFYLVTKTRNFLEQWNKDVQYGKSLQNNSASNPNARSNQNNSGNANNNQNDRNRSNLANNDSSANDLTNSKSDSNKENKFRRFVNEPSLNKYKRSLNEPSENKINHHWKSSEKIFDPSENNKNKWDKNNLGKSSDNNANKNGNTNNRDNNRMDAQSRSRSNSARSAGDKNAQPNRTRSASTGQHKITTAKQRQILKMKQESARRAFFAQKVPGMDELWIHQQLIHRKNRKKEFYARYKHLWANKNMHDQNEDLGDGRLKNWSSLDGLNDPSLLRDANGNVILDKNRLADIQIYGYDRFKKSSKRKGRQDKQPYNNHISMKLNSDDKLGFGGGNSEFVRGVLTEQFLEYNQYAPVYLRRDLRALVPFKKQHLTHQFLCTPRYLKDGWMNTLERSYKMKPRIILINDDERIITKNRQCNVYVQFLYENDGVLGADRAYQLMLPDRGPMNPSRPLMISPEKLKKTKLKTQLRPDLALREAPVFVYHDSGTAFFENIAQYLAGNYAKLSPQTARKILQFADLKEFEDYLASKITREEAKRIAYESGQSLVDVDAIRRDLFKKIIDKDNNDDNTVYYHPDCKYDPLRQADSKNGNDLYETKQFDIAGEVIKSTFVGFTPTGQVEKINPNELPQPVVQTVKFADELDSNSDIIV